jgi:hypothetical protein
VPWWGAIVIAVTATTIGFAFDAGSGNKELTSVFGALYFIGCAAAVLAVRQNSVFTAVVQPPLLLFVAVPSAYYLFNSSSINGIKDILINCGYPLIERFLLMLTTSLTVLVIGAARWYFGSRAAPEADEDIAKANAKPAFAGLRAKLSALINGTDPEDLDEADDSTPRPRAHGVERSAAAARKSGTRRTAGSRNPKRPPPTRSRHARPPIDDLDAEPPRRRRPARDLGEEPETPRRRPRPTREQREPREPGLRSSSREYRPRERDPRDRDPRDRDPYERPRRRPNRFEPYEPSESYEAPPRPRRPASGSGSGSTHHPVSRVRYRGSDEGDDRVEHRTRPRTTARHSTDSDRWRYDS